VSPRRSHDGRNGGANITPSESKRNEILEKIVPISRIGLDQLRYIGYSNGLHTNILGFAVKCPYCGHVTDRVVDSREIREGHAVWRRRECLDCSRRFTTYEEIDVQPIWVAKADRRREPFDRDKVRRGLQLALKKRPFSPGTIELIVEEIEQTLYQAGLKEVSTREVGEMVMEKLKSLDEVAYVRFASVYRKFEDANQFRDVLTLLNGSPDGTRSNGIPAGYNARRTESQR
jgi:transcriptional repressor NrdR